MTERATKPVAAVASATLAIHAALAGRYGFHRDELYFIACGRHLAFGYADQPPITPLLARLCTTLFGDHLWPLRIVAALLHVGIIVVAALIARELGGRKGAQTLAALAAAGCPYFFGAGSLLATATVDVLAWSVITLLVVRAIVRDAPRTWLWVGVAFGIGLQNKWMPVFLALYLAIGLLFTPDGRRRLRTPWLIGGAAVALMLWLPNLVWQATHGWPSFEVMHNNNQAVVADNGRLRFLPEQVGLLALLVPLAVIGWRWLWRHERLRPFAIAVLAALVIQLALGGKSYYPGGLYTIVLAAGAVAVEGARRWMAIAALTAVVTLPFTAPALPVSAYVALGGPQVNKELGEEVGWQDLADQVAEVYRSLPDEARADARIVVSSYGEAGALQLYGPARGIPAAIVLSGQNSYHEWWPSDAPTGAVITVRYPIARLAPLFAGCRQVASIDNDEDVDNSARGTPIGRCDRPLQPPAAIRAALRILQ